jgi:hypothetical protein
VVEGAVDPAPVSVGVVFGGFKNCFDGVFFGEKKEGVDFDYFGVGDAWHLYQVLRLF